MPDKTLKQKTIVGALWEGIHNGGATFLAFVSTIVLARLLTPEDYGYVGMLAIFIAIAETLVNGGFGSALIQKKKPSDADYSTVFYINIAVSWLMYLLLFLFAPAISRFYHMPLLSGVLRVQGLIVVVNALKLVQENILRKKLDFKKITIVEVSIASIALVLVIYLAWKGFGVWSLVIWRLFIGVATTIVYWVLSDWRPSHFFSRKSMKELFAFGGFMLLSSIINQIYANFQGLLIGRNYSAATMGYYSKAQNAESLSSSLLYKVSSNVSYPVLAEYQENKDALVSVLQKMIRVILFVTLPLMMLLFLIAEPLFVLLYSERWLASVPFFRILCFMGIFTSVEGVENNSIAALGLGRAYFRQNLIKKIVGIAIIAAGMLIHGIVGLLVGMVAASLFNYFVSSYLVDKHVGYRIRAQLSDVLPIVLLTSISMMAGWLVSWFAAGINMYLVAIFQIVVFWGIYLLGAHLMKFEVLSLFKDVTSVY